MSVRSKFLGRLAAEFGVIVLGVLVALAVDDWRAAKSDRDREAYFLASLQEDLAADIADFRAAKANGQARVAAAAYITEHLGARTPTAYGRESMSGTASFAPAPGATRPEDLTAAMQQMATVANFDFSDGTHEEILSTASFGIIRSGEIRRAISNYYAFTVNRSEADNRIREALFQYYEALRVAGLAPGDDGELLRQLPGESLEPLLAAVRLNWGLAATQGQIADELEAQAQALVELLDRYDRTS